MFVFLGQALLPDLTAQATSGRYVRMCLTGIKVIAVSLLLTFLASGCLASR